MDSVAFERPGRLLLAFGICFDRSAIIEIDPLGSGPPKGMEPGERKRLQSDRVILQPGPESELAVVREIFRQFVFEQQSESLIARELNREGILNRRGSPWTHQSVRYVLNNENYNGVNVYNRKTCQLGRKLRNNSPNLWVRPLVPLNRLSTRNVSTEHSGTGSSAE
jgi:hypothetical protein